jgi:glycosyltransferase involved in cell wall biosynthesis
MISVLILAKNEEANIAACLQSVAWSDDVVVLDDHSTDRTVELAKAHGARVIVHSAGGERAQRTYAIHEISFKYPWVYNPDADEITPEDLCSEMLSVVSDPKRLEVAYRVRFKNMFMGKWIKHASIYPTWVVRLFRPGAISFARETNLEYRVAGPEGRLVSHFEHYSFNKGFSAWFAKNNIYSDLEAIEALKSTEAERVAWHEVFKFRSPAVRRKALKALAWRLPFRAAIVFLYLVIVRRGILDGRAGLTYCTLRAIYEYMIDVKIIELQRRKSGLRT